MHASRLRQPPEQRRKHALKRLELELKRWISQDRAPSQVIHLEIVDGDMFHWRVLVKGPEESPYENRLFWIELEFPIDYPWKPMKNKFQTSIYHCNINTHGKDCLDITYAPTLSLFFNASALQPDAHSTKKGLSTKEEGKGERIF